jgi:hypothetical protein
VAQGSQRDPGILVNVALANLDEATELSEARKAHWDRFSGERVQNHIDAFAFGQIEDGFGEIAPPRIDHMFHSKGSEKAAFRRAARARNDLSAEMKRNLDGSHADSARARVDQDTLLLAQTGDVLQRMPCGHEDDRQSRRRLERQSCWNPPHIAGTRDRVRSQSKERKPKDFVAGGYMGDTGSNRSNDSADLIAKDASVGGVARVKGQGFQDVAEIHSRRFHFDQHLTRLALRQFEWNEPKTIEMTALLRVEPQGQRRVEPLFAPWQSTIESPDVTSFAAKSDFSFGIVPR